MKGISLKDSPYVMVARLLMDLHQVACSNYKWNTAVTSVDHY